MIDFTFISLGLGAALIVGLAVALDRAGIASNGSGTGILGVAFVWSDLPERPRGVQEDDLPRFVFRDRPWAPPSDAPTTPAPRFGRTSIAVG